MTYEDPFNNSRLSEKIESLKLLEGKIMRRGAKKKGIRLGVSKSVNNFRIGKRRNELLEDF